MDAPRDDLFRAVSMPAELGVSGDDAGRTMFGHFAVFDEWTEIHSFYEGDFLERIAPGSFAKTMTERRDQVKVLYDHGHDAQIGNKVLGSISDLREDSMGAFYEVDLLDTRYVDDLLPGLRAGLYGASFRFQVIRDEWDEAPQARDHNPHGLPERTIREVRLFEFGPVTFPAYDSATAGVRSVSDHYHDLRTRRHPDRTVGADDAPRATSSAPQTHPLVIPHNARRARIARLDGRHMEAS